MLAANFEFWAFVHLQLLLQYFAKSQYRSPQHAEKNTGYSNMHKNPNKRDHGWPAYPSTDASLSDNLVEGIERQDPAFYCRSHGQGHGCHVERSCSHDGE